MKPWEDLSIARKMFYIGCVWIYLSAEKIDILLMKTKQTYNIMRKEKIRKEGMN